MKHCHKNLRKRLNNHSISLSSLEQKSNKILTTCKIKLTRLKSNLQISSIKTVLNEASSWRIWLNTNNVSLSIERPLISTFKKTKTAGHSTWENPKIELNLLSNASRVSLKSNKKIFWLSWNKMSWQQLLLEHLCNSANCLFGVWLMSQMRI